MISFKSISAFLVILVLLCTEENAISCSMYKLTKNGKTMVGSNYDAYYLTSRIWFENASHANNYGAAFIGGRFDGNNGMLPQSGLNEAGLSFSRLVAVTPKNNKAKSKSEKVITNASGYLKEILHTCKTVEEVKAFIDQYDHSYFNEEVALYIDQFGKYLIVEPYSTTIGNDAKYVLANFCPSVTEPGTIKQERYLKGVHFLKNKMETDIDFCTALSDTMHVCREKIGDGTLLTMIRDLNERNIYLYFYHDFKNQLKFNINEELAKGDHMYEIPKIFPKNVEYEKLINYKTPNTSKAVMQFMIFSFGLFFFSALFYFVSYFRKRKTEEYSFMKLVLFLIGIIMVYYTTALVKTETIFYFPAPYKDYHLSLLTFAAYIPFLILLIIIPLFAINYKLFKKNLWSSFSRWLFVINNMTYITMISLFIYWGLYDVF